jgi:hemoglobin
MTQPTTSPDNAPHAAPHSAAPGGHPVAAPANGHYVRLGGQDAVVRLVEAFYRAMDTLPAAATIRAMHEPDLGPTRKVLVAYLSEWMGGPKVYTPQRGAPMLRRRHQPFAIDAAARDAWMLCMRQALDEVCVDAALRAELDAAFYKVADFIRNTESGGDTRAHPGRPREVAPGMPAAPHQSQT